MLLALRGFLCASVYSTALLHVHQLNKQLDEIMSSLKALSQTLAVNGLKPKPSGKAPLPIDTYPPPTSKPAVQARQR